jgi:hypothetical protein
MTSIRRVIPLSLTVAFGVLSLIGLLFVPSLGDLLTEWASFLAAVALLLGVLNLLSVHIRRLAEGNAYSLVLVLSTLAVFGLAVTDYLDLTEEGVESTFVLVQAPLEAALAALVAFFLLFAAFRLLQQRRSWWSVLFVTTVILVLLSQTPLPSTLSSLFRLINDNVTDLIVSAGMRGILIGIALGTITVSLRLLTGTERPYDK